VGAERLVQSSGDTEVEQDGTASCLFEENVRGLDVAVDQPAGMEDGERRADFFGDPHHPPNRQRSTLSKQLGK
jgi:hypothetical protein